MVHIVDFSTLVMTHNFPSLNERTKMLSFFTVTSSWQSGEMTLLHRNKRQSRGQMRLVMRMRPRACVCACVCDVEEDRESGVGESITKSTFS